MNVHHLHSVRPVSDGISIYKLSQRNLPTAENIEQTKTVMPYAEKLTQEVSKNEHGDILTDYSKNGQALPCRPT